LALSLGFSSFEVLYGYAPRHFGVESSAVCPIPSLQEWIEEKKVMMDLVKQHLARAQLRMKVQADKKRYERSFQIGDMVYVRLQPYVQSSLAHRANQKLVFRFFGPFKVLSTVGSVAYKLELSASSTIHPVFHVSQLKRAVPDATSGYLIPWTVFRYPSACCDVACHLMVKLKCWFSGPVCRHLWQHGWMLLLCGKPFLARLLGDKQVL
jgi:hypothetical protein